MPVLILLEEHEIYQKASSQHDCFHAYIQVHWEFYTKVVSVCEVLPRQSGPLFGNLSYLIAIQRRDLKVNIRAPSAAESQHVPGDREYLPLLCVQYCEVGIPEGAVLSHVPYDLSRGGLHLHLLKAAEAAPSSAPVGTDDMDNFVLCVVHD